MDMKKIVTVGAVVLAGFVLVGCGKGDLDQSAAGVAGAPRVAEGGFGRIAAELDFGGDYYEVVNAATFRSDVQSFVELAAEFAGEYRVMVPKALAAMDRLGLLSFRGVGMSVKQVEPDVYEHRQFLLMDSASTPLFEMMAAGEPGSPVGELFLPDTSAVALSAKADVASQLPVIAECADMFVPGMGASVLSELKEQAAFVEDIAAGTALAVTLDDKLNWTVPEAPVPVTVPAPGLLIVQKVSGDRPWKALLEALGVPGVRHAEYPSVTTCSFPVPLGDVRAFRVEPVFAYDAEKGVLLAASMPDVLERALAAGCGSRGRLLDDAAFVRSIGRLEPHNGLNYLSPKLLPTVAKAVREGVPPALLKDVPIAVRKLIDNPPAFWAAGVSVRRPDGVASRMRASFGACNTLRLLGGSSGVASLASAFSTAIPNFIKYRSEARRNACLSNMKMLEAAGEQWLMVVGGSGVPKMSDLIGADKYIRMTPVCGEGGRYSLEKGSDGSIEVGCSVHGALR